MCVRSSARVGAAAAVTERAGLERRRFFSPRRLGLRLQGPRMASGFGTRAPVGRCFPVYRVRLPLPWRAATPRDNAGSSPPAGVCGVHLGEEWVAFGEGGGVRGAA